MKMSVPPAVGFSPPATVAAGPPEVVGFAPCVHAASTSPSTMTKPSRRVTATTPLRSAARARCWSRPRLPRARGKGSGDGGGFFASRDDRLIDVHDLPRHVAPVEL